MDNLCIIQNDRDVVGKQKPVDWTDENKQCGRKILVISLDKVVQSGYTIFRNGAFHNGCVAFAYLHGGCRFYFYCSDMIEFFICIVVTGRLIFFKINQILILILSFVSNVKSNFVRNTVKYNFISKFVPVFYIFVSHIFRFNVWVVIAWFFTCRCRIISCGSKKF